MNNKVKEESKNEQMLLCKEVFSVFKNFAGFNIVKTISWPDSDVSGDVEGSSDVKNFL